MTTYLYTGKIADFGDAPFPEAVPSLYVVPEQDAFGASSGVHAARRIPIVLHASGVFSVQLVASGDLSPVTRYSLRCDWLDVTGNVRGWAEWTFTAAIGGGPISQMKDAVFTRWWVSTSPPPVDRSGIYWLNPVTGDVKEWINQ